MNDNQMTYADVRNTVQKIAEQKGFHAGIPIPLDGTELDCVYFNELGQPRFEVKGYRYINEWFSPSRNLSVLILEHEETGRREVLKMPANLAGMRLDFTLETIGASIVWDVKAELQATRRLGSMLKKHKFEMYLLNGMFLEKSNRSNIMYLLRKGRPTLAMSMSGQVLKILAALCLHPLGYYKGTFAGGMVPTDDVIAHLAMIRGDEHAFWAKANQHRVWSVLSGI